MHLSADAWASQCLWNHGPPQAMTSTGQNLSVMKGRKEQHSQKKRKEKKSQFVHKENDDLGNCLWINAACVMVVAATSTSLIWSGPGVMSDTTSPIQSHAADLCALTTQTHDKAADYFNIRCFSKK